MTRILAVDVGQTGMRASWGDVVREGEGGVLALTDSHRVRTLVDRVVGLTHEIGSSDVVGVGLSGFVEGSSATAEFAAQLLRRLPVRTVAVAADAVTAHLGTVGMRAGTTIICGTGVAALGSDGRHRWRRIDARGYLLGDFGSGFWIGQRGLQAALDALEGRGPDTTLVEASRRLGTPADIYQSSMASVPAPRYLASFAPAVLTSAGQGDEIALVIVAEAANQLARSIAAARLVDGPIGVTGGLVRSEVLTAALIAAIERVGIVNSDPIIRPDAALQGARLLAEEHELAATLFPGLISVEENHD